MLVQRFLGWDTNIIVRQTSDALMQHVNQTLQPRSSPTTHSVPLLGLTESLPPKLVRLGLAVLVFVQTIMMEGHRVETLEWIGDLITRGREATIQWDTLDLGSTDINRFGFLDRAEVDRIDAFALIRDDGWLAVAKQSPLGTAEEGMSFTSLAPAREPRRRSSSFVSSLRMTDLHVLETGVTPAPSGNGTSSRKMLANVAFLFLPLNGVVPKSIS